MRRLLLHASHITRIYRAGEADEVHALRDLSLRIYAGDFVAILGPDGAGKTTLLRILSLRDRPTAGDLYYEGRLVTGLSDAELLDIRPTLLLADEPTRGRKPPARELILNALRLENRRGTTIILATADPEAAAHGSTIYRLDKGIIYLIGG